MIRACTSQDSNSPLIIDPKALQTYEEIVEASRARDRKEAESEGKAEHRATNKVKITVKHMAGRG